MMTSFVEWGNMLLTYFGILAGLQWQPCMQPKLLCAGLFHGSHLHSVAMVRAMTASSGFLELVGFYGYVPFAH